MAKPVLFPLGLWVSSLVLFTTMSLVAGEALNIVNVTGNDGKLRGEGNFVDVKIYYHSGSSVLTVWNAWLSWGKWVPGNGDYHNEIGSPDGMSMTAWGEYHIASTGREYSPSGTEASVDIYTGDERVLYLYWQTNYGGSSYWKHESFSNKFTVKYTAIGESYLLLTVVFVEVEGGEAAQSELM